MRAYTCGVRETRFTRHRLEIQFQFCPNSGIEFGMFSGYLALKSKGCAYYISRIIDTYDWQITASCFTSLETRWGVHTVACFASYYVLKEVGRFKFWNTGCSGVHFFVANLKGQNCLVLSVGLITRDIHNLFLSRSLPH